MTRPDGADPDTLALPLTQREARLLFDALRKDVEAREQTRPGADTPGAVALAEARRLQERLNLALAVFDARATAAQLEARLRAPRS
jgi:hypothetical protein